MTLRFFFLIVSNAIFFRYNIERFSNRLKRATRLSNFREPLEVGYFPKLDTLVASRNYPGRHAGAVLKVLTLFMIIIIIIICLLKLPICYSPLAL